MISVVLPVRDGERWLDAALVSIRQQTVEEIEIVVVDDGSVDASLAIAVRHAAEDDRVRVVELAGGGLPAALNAGIAEATGDWIARMDADDIALPHRFERQLAAATAAPDIAGWSSWARIVDADDREIGTFTTGPTTVAEFWAVHGGGRPLELLHPAMLVRRQVLIDVGGYDDRLPMGEDVELWDRVAEAGHVLLAIPEPLLRYRVTSGSLSTRRLGDGARAERFIAARHRARERGRPLDWEEFLADEADRSPLRRWWIDLSVRGRIAFRKAGLAAAAGRLPRATAYLLQAASMNPAYAIPRLVHQLRSRRAAR